MSIWRWVFKIAIQVIPILLGIDWARPKPDEKFLDFKPRKKKRTRNFFDDIY